MPLKDILQSELVFANQSMTSKKRVLEQVASIASNRLHCDKECVYDALLAREKLGSTGVGKGIAVPHCRLEAANKTAVVMLSLEKPVDFDSVDRTPVDLIFALIVPPHECETHLSTLAQIAELTQTEAQLEVLRNATSNKALYSALLSMI
ncbi:PTS fructose transporter subunit IIA [Marinomonas agarivorans]|nr:PTS fructose transporter subunit IIA [Marinomonas agarivorans]